ncbi:CRE-SRV-6 protein [Caenorhabditis remanei]|uniref:CRE-SRV-6 protein n=1 Tax=Caenorhabditis remanei TaxID=31234 RepID=E3LEL0_CAERE|nr:CRE-SRV-6 protein [Caenorhabditis remanei]
MPFEQTLLFLLGLFSILLYTLIVRTLKKHRKTPLLGGTFFKLVVLQFYAEAFFFLEFSLTMRFRKYTDFYTFFESGTQFTGIVPRIISGVHYYIKVWGPTTIMWISITQWFVPILAILPTHAWPEFDFYLVITSTAMRLTNDGVSTALISYIDGFCCLVTCIFCISCYIITGFLIRKNWKRSSSTVFKKTSTQSSAERGLFISAVLSFCVLMLNLTLQILKIIISWNGMTNIFAAYDFSTLKLDEASMSMGRAGQTNGVSKTSPAS